MSPPVPQPARHDDRAGSSDTTPSWAADMAEAEAGTEAARLPEPDAAPRQLPLFQADDLAPAPAAASARTRGARLPGRLKALLTRPAAPGAAPTGDSGGLASSLWPDSFFDVNAGSWA